MGFAGQVFAVHEAMRGDDFAVLHFFRRHDAGDAVAVFDFFLVLDGNGSHLVIHDEFWVDRVDDPVEIFGVVDMAIVVDIQVSDAKSCSLRCSGCSWIGLCMRTMVRIAPA